MDDAEVVGWLAWVGIFMLGGGISKRLEGDMSIDNTRSLNWYCGVVWGCVGGCGVDDHA